METRPGRIPTDRVDALRTAFSETMKDKDFLAEMQKLNHSQRIVESMKSVSEKIRLAAQKIYE